MARKLAIVLISTMVLAVVAVSACAPAAPVPTTAPAPAAAPTALPTKAAATTAPTTASTTVPTSAPTAALAATSAVAPTTAAAPTAAGAAATGDVAAGKAVFDQNCNACHPGGDKGVGPALKGLNLSADTIKTTVRSGKGGMPAFTTSQISDAQLNNLVAYVQSLK